MTRHHADIAGRRLSWLQAGQGQPLVLLHPFPVHAGYWQPQLDAVPHGWTLIAPDLRGFGESRGPAATSVDDHAEDVLALLRHLNIEQAVVGGLSIGGYITFAIHRLAPQRCRALVLADTRAEPDTDEARAGREKLQADTRAQGVIAAWNVMGPKVLRPAARADAAFEARVRAIALSNDPAGVIDGLEALKTRPDSRPTLAQITAPTLIIVGDQDEVTPMAMAESMQKGIRTSTLTIVPNAGHFTSLEQPEAFNRALWPFVQAL